MIINIIIFQKRVIDKKKNGIVVEDKFFFFN